MNAAKRVAALRAIELAGGDPRTDDMTAKVVRAKARAARGMRPKGPSQMAPSHFGLGRRLRIRPRRENR